MMHPPAVNFWKAHALVPKLLCGAERWTVPQWPLQGHISPLPNLEKVFPSHAGGPK